MTCTTKTTNKVTNCVLTNINSNKFRYKKYGGQEKASKIKQMTLKSLRAYGKCQKTGLTVHLLKINTLSDVTGGTTVGIYVLPMDISHEEKH